MKRSAVAVLVLGLAACFGAGLAQRARSRPQDPPRAQEGVQQGAAIDQDEVLELAKATAPADFAERSMAHLRAITEMGPRHTSATPTPGWSQQLDYIERELQRVGVPVERDTWTDRKELLTFCNLRGTIRGKREERIVLACHHDTKCTQGHADKSRNFHFVGANDGGSGVAFLLALAPTLVARANEATIELVFFDGEESLDWTWNDAARALFGSKRYVKQQRELEMVGKATPVRALVLLDMVARTDLHVQEELYSSKDLRRITWSAAKAAGHDSKFFRISRAASDDHVPFLEAGIPSVDLIDLEGNPHWHTATDTIENCSGESMRVVADVLLTMLPAVERAYVGAGR